MWEAIAAIAGAVGTIITGTGIWFVARQIQDGRRSMKAQFVSQLETEIVSLYDTYTKLLPGEAWSSAGSGPQSRGEISRSVPYLGFFVKIKFLIDIGAIDIDLIDRMFVFRFFLVVHNRHVQEKILYCDLYKDHWSEIFALHNRWSDFRRSRGRNIPFSETSLERFDRSRYLLKVEDARGKLLS